MGSAPSQLDSPRKVRALASSSSPTSVTDISSSNIIFKDVDELLELPAKTFGIYCKLGSSRRILFYQDTKWGPSDYHALGAALRASGILERLTFMRFHNMGDDDLATVLKLADPESLKVLELGFCISLTRVPDLASLAPRLHQLGLYGCSSLGDLPDPKFLKHLKTFTPPMHLNEALQVQHQPMLQLRRQKEELEQRNRELEERNRDLEHQLSQHDGDGSQRNRDLRLELKKRKEAHGALEQKYGVLELKYGALEFLQTAQVQHGNGGGAALASPRLLQHGNIHGGSALVSQKRTPSFAAAGASAFTPRGARRFNSTARAIACAQSCSASESTEEVGDLGANLDMESLRMRALGQRHMSQLGASQGASPRFVQHTASSLPSARATLKY